MFSGKMEVITRARDVILPQIECKRQLDGDSRSIISLGHNGRERGPLTEIYSKRKKSYQGRTVGTLSARQQRKIWWMQQWEVLCVKRNAVGDVTQWELMIFP